MVSAARELEALAASLPGLADRDPSLAGFFGDAREVVLTRAPGRLDVMGGIADYSGSLVLELPLAVAARVAVAQTDDDLVRVASLSAPVRIAEFAAAPLFEATRSFEGLRRYFAAQPAASRFGAYLLGGLAWLRERGARFGGGLRLLLDSSVPEGAGVSSSAAIEVAALRGLCELYGVSVSGPELGLACQAVENRVVGAACGVMDQMTSACGVADRLLALWCQPAVLRGQLALPEGLSVFGINSGVRHAVVGSDYTGVRVAAFMGLRILSERLGARVREVGEGAIVLEDDPLAGYLANLKPEALVGQLGEALPEEISGREFLERFDGISDTATHVDSARSYMVRAATSHPIQEHARVESFARLLQSGAASADWKTLGQWMLQSHASYSACGLGSDATDRLVGAVASRLGEGRLFGAKITGGGSGGTVAVLARTDALADVRAIAEEHAAWLGRPVGVFSGSSPGALAIPALREAL